MCGKRTVTYFQKNLTVLFEISVKKGTPLKKGISGTKFPIFVKKGIKNKDFGKKFVQKRAQKQKVKKTVKKDVKKALKRHRGV